MISGISKMQSGNDINKLFQEAQSRWLKPAEVLFILQNHDKHQIIQEPPHKPTSGSLLLYDKRETRFFRKDGHNWRKKRDGRAVGEAHEKLKVGNAEALNCYYAHGEDNPNFQRRSYWMLDPAHEHIVLVQYRERNEGKPSPRSAAQSSVLSSALSPSLNSHAFQNSGSDPVISDIYEPPQNLFSPMSTEVSSHVGIKNLGLDHTEEHTISADLEVSEALRRLEEQLSLNEDGVRGINPFNSQDWDANALETLEYGKEISKNEPLHGPDSIREDGTTGLSETQNDLSNLVLPSARDGNEESLYWKYILDLCQDSSSIESQEKLHTSSRTEPPKQHDLSYWSDNNISNIEDSYMLLPQEVGSVQVPPWSSAIETLETDSDCYAMLLNQGLAGTPPLADSNITTAEKQKFIIQEISPDWGYSTEPTKVIIVGSFLCDPSESAWTCMFGETEVPVEILQEGVLRCVAPPRHPGKVNLCISCTNPESCSEVREFEYRAQTSSSSQNNPEASKSIEELRFLVKFVQLLLSDSPSQKERGDSTDSGDLLRKLKDDDDPWSHVMESLLVGNRTFSDTADFLLQELLKDRLQLWLSSKSKEACSQLGCSLSKKDQGIIHLVAGLGFEWALNPTLSHGVGINFRDINGWTALHWAARFGREKMVAALLASGASAGAVTDPNSQDPVGKTAASIAASNGHNGLAGYLSEAALTSHLDALTLEESELSKGSAETTAEITVNSISKGSIATYDDSLSLKETLAAVRNAAQAAARIQNAFREHSFKKRQQREAAAAAAASCLDEYGLHLVDNQGLSVMPKRTSRNARDFNAAALSIQKNYKGWKGRKDFLTLRKKVVKIQAHVRGYQVRKQYKVICWAVGILEKIVLRWRRKGAGLRGFQTEPLDENENEDFLKIFRKQKVDAAIEEAFSRVLAMVDSPDARQQYRRVLEKYHQAKAELGDTNKSEEMISADDMENDDDLLQLG